MTTQQPEALRLAGVVERLNVGVHSQAIFEEYSAAARELRRQHARIVELEAQIAAAQQAVQDATAHPADGVPAQVAGALQALRTIAEYPSTDLMMNMDAANMRLIAEQAIAATQPAAQGMDAQTIKRISALGELARMPNAEYFADANNAAVRHLRALAAQAKQGGAA